MHDAGIPVYDQVRQVWSVNSQLFLEAFHVPLLCLPRAVSIPLSRIDRHISVRS